MLFPLSTIKKFHAEIVFIAWARDLREKNICLLLFTFLFTFFQDNTSRKFLNLLLFYLPVFDCKYRLHLPLFSLNIITFLACTCEPVGTQHSFQFHCVVSGLGVYVWLKRYLHVAKVQATGVPLCSRFNYLSAFLSRLWKVNIDQNWNPF